MIARKSCRHMAAARALAAIFVFQLSGLAAGAQALSVLPVNIFFAPGERATSLTVTNQGKAETAIQIRAFDWSQKGNDDQLAPTGVVVLSPPIAKLAPGATQVIRIVLRQSPATSEATYRILVDQIPPPAEPGVVHMVLRMSIPIFVQPAIRSFADVQFHLERSDGQIYLVGFTEGKRWPHVERGLQLIALYTGRHYTPLAPRRAGFPAAVKRSPAVDCSRERRRN